MFNKKTGKDKYEQMIKNKDENMKKIIDSSHANFLKWLKYNKHRIMHDIDVELNEFIKHDDDAFCYAEINFDYNKDEKNPYVLLYNPRGIKSPYRSFDKKIKNVYIFDKSLDEDLQFYGEIFKNWVEDELGLYASYFLSFRGVAIFISYDKNVIKKKNN